ncbi:MAG: amidohydrolase family protein [Gammaproteobacteria bacterium]|nr:amidohydrolase family protein [Gammaproteobacteria bacterium]
MKILLFMAALAVSAQGVPTPGAAPHRDLLIKNVRIVSAGPVSLSERADLVVHKGRIARIGYALSEDDYTFARVIDGAGRYLSPGLIDGHVHLGEVPGMSYAHEVTYADLAEETRAQMPRSFLYHGFTTLVDLNSNPRAMADWNRRDIRPRAYFCGGTPVVNGYPMSFMPKPARYRMMPYFLYDETRADEFPEGFDPEAHSPAAVVDRIRADGGICVKTHYERGFGGRGNLPVPSEEKIRELIAAAHARGMPVLLHANSQSSQRFGTAVDVDAFVHGMWTWDDRATTELHSGITDILDAAIQENIALQPTVQVLYGERDLHDPDYLEKPALKDVLPQNLIDWYATEDGQWWRRRMLNIPYFADMADKGLWREIDAEPIARVNNATTYFVKKGGRLLFGSDTPSDPTYANPPGLNGRLEMNNWLAAGITPQQLFYAATLGNARFYGLQDEIGSVAEGKRADLLLTTKNPMQDVSAYDRIEFVIVGGRVFKREELSAKNTP